MNIRLNSNEKVEYYKNQFDLENVPVKDKITLKIRAIVEATIRASKVAFHKTMVFVEAKRLNRDEVIEEHEERIEEHLPKLMAACGLILKPKDTLDEIPDEIESESESSEEEDEEILNREGTMSIRLNKGETLERYQRIFQNHPAGLIHHISVRARGIVETVIQVAKIAFHKVAALSNMMRKNEEKAEAHLGRSTENVFALKIAAGTVFRPRKTLLEKVDDAAIEFFNNARP